mmetsp:Transcript_3026/g.4379  ORF Transcript_3026/g.4379 Transcript_3026/m.4379 type:complete len:684 (+) Transcript_3026:45-2096(+)
MSTLLFQVLAIACLHTFGADTVGTTRSRFASESQNSKALVSRPSRLHPIRSLRKRNPELAKIVSVRSASSQLSNLLTDVSSRLDSAKKELNKLRENKTDDTASSNKMNQRRRQSLQAGFAVLATSTASVLSEALKPHSTKPRNEENKPNFQGSSVSKSSRKMSIGDIRDWATPAFAAAGSASAAYTFGVNAAKKIQEEEEPDVQKSVYSPNIQKSVNDYLRTKNKFESALKGLGQTFAGGKEASIVKAALDFVNAVKKRKELAGDVLDENMAQEEEMLESIPNGRWRVAFTTATDAKAFQAAGAKGAMWEFSDRAVKLSFEGGIPGCASGIAKPGRVGGPSNLKYELKEFKTSYLPAFPIRVTGRLLPMYITKDLCIVYQRGNPFPRIPGLPRPAASSEDEILILRREQSEELSTPEGERQPQPQSQAEAPKISPPVFASKQNTWEDLKARLVSEASKSTQAAFQKFETTLAASKKALPEKEYASSIDTQEQRKYVSLENSRQAIAAAESAQQKSMPASIPSVASFTSNVFQRAVKEFNNILAATENLAKNEFSSKSNDATRKVLEPKNPTRPADPKDENQKDPELLTVPRRRQARATGRPVVASIAAFESEDDDELVSKNQVARVGQIMSGIEEAQMARSRERAEIEAKLRRIKSERARLRAKIEAAGMLAKSIESSLKQQV